MKVRFTPSARAQFLAALKYIRQDNPRAALRFRKRTESVLRRLTRFPESGRIVPEFPEVHPQSFIAELNTFLDSVAEIYPGRSCKMKKAPTQFLLAVTGCSNYAILLTNGGTRAPISS